MRHPDRLPLRAAAQSDRPWRFPREHRPAERGRSRCGRCSVQSTRPSRLRRRCRSALPPECSVRRPANHCVPVPDRDRTECRGTLRPAVYWRWTRPRTCCGHRQPAHRPFWSPHRALHRRHHRSPPSANRGCDHRRAASAVQAAPGPRWGECACSGRVPVPGKESSRCTSLPNGQGPRRWPSVQEFAR